MEIENRVFKKEHVSPDDLCHARLQGCTFENCNLSLVKLNGTRLQEIAFTKCKLVGVDFTKCDPTFLSLQFQECVLDTCNLSDLDLKWTSFQKCILRETYFINANLTSANFEGADLKGSTFHNSNLSKANFRNAINYSINPLTNKIAKATFSRPEVMSLLDHLDITIVD